MIGIPKKHKPNSQKQKIKTNFNKILTILVSIPLKNTKK